MYKRWHDSIPASLKLGRVSDFAYRCFGNGLSRCDWFGRLPADPEKFIIICFPNRRQVTVQEVKEALDELAEVLGEGLLHLYETGDGERFMVIHNHEKHNARSTHERVAAQWPAPPKGLCKCVRYSKVEGPGPKGGREFRFLPKLFPLEFPPKELAVSVCPEQALKTDLPGSQGEEKQQQQLSATCMHMHARACTCVHAKHVFSSLIAVREGSGEGAVDVAAWVDRVFDEFSKISGRRPWRSAGDREEIRGLLMPLLRERGLPRCLEVVRAKLTREFKRHGEYPTSMRYFIPILADPANFPALPVAATPLPSMALERAKLDHDDTRIDRALESVGEELLATWRADAVAEAERGRIPAYLRARFVTEFTRSRMRDHLERKP